MKPKTPKAVGRPRMEREARRDEIVKVSLNAGELSEILKVTNAPAAFLREHGLKAARKLNPPKKSRV
jgi:hypothetical protein